MSCKGAVEVGGYFMINDGKKLTDRLYAMGLLFTLFTQINHSHIFREAIVQAIR